MSFFECGPAYRHRVNEACRAATAKPHAQWAQTNTERIESRMKTVAAIDRVVYRAGLLEFLASTARAKAAEERAGSVRGKRSSNS
jgi:hypothetical protein